ncbi:MAG: GTP cyclohydrolase II [Alphaproteobacteria bacterium]
MERINEDGIISMQHLAAGRAVDQLRRQLGIVFDTQDTSMGACPLEGITPQLFAGLPQENLRLLITGARANHLKLSETKEGVVCVDVSGWTLEQMRSLADPLAKQADLPDIKLLSAQSIYGTLITLAKHATLLPAMLLIQDSDFPSQWLDVNMEDIAGYWAAPPLDIVEVTHANLPVQGAEDTRIYCFRTRFGTSTHLALLVGEPEKQHAPLIRVHSSCITGDILGSLRCDCGDQLQVALGQIQEAGHGVLLYLHQEGRGIGIANKIRAYALQEKGFDTYDANLMLGYDEDERDFTLAAEMLSKLGIGQVRLMTNNPAKIEKLRHYGIAITERVPLKTGAGKYNQAYLDAKAKKSGHLF